MAARARLARRASPAVANRSMPASGAIAVQIVHSHHGWSWQIEHIGSAHDDAELELLKAVARQRLADRHEQLDLRLGFGARQGGPLPITS
jgi:hypothetical protein